MAAMFHWARGHEALMWWLGSASVVLLLVTVVAVPVIIIRLPQDYFVRDTRDRWRDAEGHPFRTPMIAVKNVIGVVFILLGLVMFLLPGQGLLTMFVGFMLLNFPGKYRMERWLVTRRAVHRAIDWLRTRAGRPPLSLPPAP